MKHNYIRVFKHKLYVKMNTISVWNHSHSYNETVDVRSIFQGSQITLRYSLTELTPELEGRPYYFRVAGRRRVLCSYVEMTFHLNVYPGQEFFFTSDTTAGSDVLYSQFLLHNERLELDSYRGDVW